MDRNVEIRELSALYGQPVSQHQVRDVPEASFRYFAGKLGKRNGEVVLFILRRNGKLLLHYKDFYPPDAFRVPTGTLHERESLLDGVYRETDEETGLKVAIARFLAVVEFEFRWGGQAILISSYLFLLTELQGELHSRDADERIAAFEEVDPGTLLAVAEHLENLPSDWADWGWFRAFPHRLAATVLSTPCLKA
jgi:ADP-ribose pyrophosphatase YjhB (NUDIX family)